MTETVILEGAKIQTKKYVANLFSVLTHLSPVQLLQLYGELLTESEAITLAKRLEIANGLLAGESYTTLQKRLRVTPNTIAQINKILKTSGVGFKSATQLLSAKVAVVTPQPKNFVTEKQGWLRYFRQ